MEQLRRIVRLLGEPDEPKRCVRGRAKTWTKFKQAERVAKMTWWLAHGESITTARIRQAFNVSKATAKRDIDVLARALLGEKAHREPGMQAPRVIRVATE